ncbi:DUF6452 family protein [Flavobacterium reichenbachii]|uniref:Lipoprotein n=1 Tax=Flavobacterium reichenbachii TaxID=362418 RepID=A0A085ZN96_9FLAO|nr:DUF6452 family protein [Flavobacterium reichenbachii]KFF05910.1 hypothetical protein IW19_10430 [Flavobacterium reichenbachii]OXB12796.1 hypothetical protein B0A68_18595 [Flavobacterium reichenbachii]
MKKIISFLLLFTFGLSSCEKDDICDADTPTTPRLVISFYLYKDPQTAANVKNLKVIGEGVESGEGIIFNENGTDVTKYLTNASTISIPLRTDADTVTYSFILNSGNTIATNTDILTFNYSRNTVYVSRACGFKTTFNLLTNNPAGNPPTTPFVRTDSPAADGFWMEAVQVIESNIESENETHIKILI